MTAAHLRDSTGGPPPRAPGLLQSRLLTAVLVILLGTGSVRTALLVLRDPVVGYANSWDMQRLENCLGISPQDVPREEASPRQTQQIYVLDGRIDTPGCLASSQILLLGPAVLVLRAIRSVTGNPVFDIRFVGAALALWFALMAVGFSGYFFRRGERGLALVNALVFCLIVADPTNTLFLNTFYAEPAAVLFAWLVIGSLFVVYSQGPTPANGALLGAGIFLLGMAKRQYLPLALVFGVLAIVLAWRIRAKLPAAFLTVVLIGMALTVAGDQYVYSRPHQLVKIIDRANKMDSVMGAILPLASDQRGAIALLGLPPECAAAVGQTWYTPGIVESNPCAAVYDLPRHRLLALLVREPLLLVRLNNTAATVLSQKANAGSLVPNLAIDEAGNRAQAGIISIARLLGSASVTRWQLLVWLPPLVFVVAAGVVFLRTRRGSRNDLAVLYLICSAGFCVTLGTSVLGDGWHEFVKHNQMSFNFLYMLGVCAGCSAAQLLWAKRRRHGQPA